MSKEMAFIIINDEEFEVVDEEARTSAASLQQIVDDGFFGEASGSVVTVDALNLPLESLVCRINASQSGSGNPTPDNVRSIIGVTGMTISVSDEDTSDPETVSIDWTDEAGTVYGGSLDVTTGVLTVDKTLITIQDTMFTKSSETDDCWVIYHSLNNFPNVKKSGYSSIICDALLGTNTSSKTANTIWHNGRNIYVCISKSDYSHYGYFNTWVSNNGLHCVVELATPVTYQLTPTEVSSLLGITKIWADTGDSDVTYYRNTQIGRLAMSMIADLT